MRSGFSVPIILIVILLFVLTPLGYYYFVIKSDNTNIKGTSDYRGSTGVLVFVNSQNSTWDMFEYLCKSMSECTTSLDSGTFFAKVSGNVTEDHEVFVEYSDKWSEYSYLKIYVQSGWGSINRAYTPTAQNLASVDGDVMYIPLQQGEKNNLIIAGSFTD